jgi:hypothetical protein
MLDGSQRDTKEIPLKARHYFLTGFFSAQIFLANLNGGASL